MAHDRRPHTRRYPLRQDGTRKYGRVGVNGAHVSDSAPDASGAGGCCLLVLIGLVFAGIKAVQWVNELFN